MKGQRPAGSHGVTEVALAALDPHVGVELQEVAGRHGGALLVVSDCREEAQARPLT